jgi:hydrogenase nickel incorporation protein HypA/HybF
MHEFSIVQNIIDIVTDSAKSNGVTKVRCVEVEVGKASGVIREAMEFAWEAAIKDTLLNGAALKIIEKPLAVKCNSCGHHYEPCDIYESCPGCGDIHPEILSGNELKVIAIET